MDPESPAVTERIVQLTLEIIYLLTGERYGPMKNEGGDHVTFSSNSSGEWRRSQSPVMELLPPFLTAQRSEKQEVLEVTSETPELPHVKGFVGMSAGSDGHLGRCKMEAEESYPGISQSADWLDSSNPQGELTTTNDHMTEGELIITMNGHVVSTATGISAEHRSDRFLHGHDGHRVGFAHSNHGRSDLYISNGWISEDTAAMNAGKMLVTRDEGLVSVSTPQSLQPHTSREEEAMAPPGGETLFPAIVKEEKELEQDVSAPESFPCSACGKRFSSRSLLVRHEKIHTGLKPFACLECGRGFNRVDNLTAHIRIHRREKPYTCHCGRSFLRKESLLLHKRSHTGEAESRKSFTNASNRSRHKRFPANQMPLLCSICGKSFMKKEDLTRHQRQHLEPQVKLPCPECGKPFPSKSQLARHRITHTGEKPFQCSECGRRFNRASNLDAHMKTHLGEKPFPCSQCGKRFLWKCQLNVHQRTHTGDKPFTCPDCGCQFASSSSLVRHRRLHTGDTKEASLVL